MSRTNSRAWLLAACLIAGAPMAQAQTPPPATASQPTGDQQRFATAEAAMAALKAALAKGDVEDFITLFGKSHEDLIVGADRVETQAERRRAAVLAKQRIALEHDGDDRALVALGTDAWLLPIPLVRKDGQWFFDTAAGEEEVLARRIGRDELGAIDAVKALVAAEQSYAARHKKAGKPAAFAPYIQSSPGLADGLWWNETTAKRQGPSPLAKFVGVQREFIVGRQPGDPFRGYYFRVLTAQGEHAPGGAMSYFGGDGAMTKGFAVIAWPADYRNSGIMTFIAGRDGHVLQKDLGEDTDALAQGLLAYDPDDSWKPVQ
jgi:hypothetical protein